MRTFWKIKDEPCCVKPNQLLTSHSSSLTIPSLPATTGTLKQGPFHPTMAQKTNMAACLLAVAALVFWEADATGPRSKVFSQTRKMLQTTPQQQILTQALCFANQAAASAEQFTGLTGGKTGLPAILNNLVGTSNSILGNLESQLSIKPAAACSTAPPAYTINDAVSSIFCSTTNIVKSLETALGLGLPAAEQTTIQFDIAQLSNSFNSIEAGLIEFLFNIKC